MAAKLPADLLAGDLIEVPASRSYVAPTRGVVVKILVRSPWDVVATLAPPPADLRPSNYSPQVYLPEKTLVTVLRSAS